MRLRTDDLDRMTRELHPRRIFSRLPAQAERRGLLDERLCAEARTAAMIVAVAQLQRHSRRQTVGQLDEQDVIERMPGVEPRIPPADAGAVAGSREQIVDGCGIARLG